MKTKHEDVIFGRGTAINPANRFEQIKIEKNEDLETFEMISPKTEFFKDQTKSFITYNDSPDLGFAAGINPYRGCEHGCVYCFARPYHEYLGFSIGLDFETKILVKENAPEILRKELMAKRWQPQVIALSGATDCYQPVERKLQITRKCLEVLNEFRNPVCIITKNRLVTRDIDLLKQMNGYKGAAVFISVTTLDRKLAGVMEPRASRPQDRLRTIQMLSEAGIPVGVLVSPVIPGLNDHEIPLILKECAQAGAQFAGYIILRLPFAVKDLFTQWLTQHFPDRKNKILNRILDIRGGKLNDPNFKSRMKGQGIFAENIANLFYVAKKRVGLYTKGLELSVEHFERPAGKQLLLFKY